LPFGGLPQKEKEPPPSREVWEVYPTADTAYKLLIYGKSRIFVWKATMSQRRKREPLLLPCEFHGLNLRDGRETEDTRRDLQPQMFNPHKTQGECFTTASTIHYQNARGRKTIFECQRRS